MILLESLHAQKTLSRAREATHFPRLHVLIRKPFIP